MLIGWGRIVRRVLSDDEGGGWPVDVWAGWAAGTVFLQVWHFALPVDWRAAAVVGLVGLAGWMLRRRPASAEIAHAFATGAVCLVLYALFVRHIRSDLLVYDAGMYYYQAIRWINEYPVVFGLGNLNLQLGINQTYFLWAGLLNLHPVGRGGFMTMNCLALVIAMAPGVRTLLRMRRADPKPDALGILRIFSLPVLAAFAMDDGTANPSPDVFSWVLCVVAFERAAAWLHAAGTGPDRTLRPPYVLVLICAALVTVKMSMLVYSAVLLAVVATVYIVRMRACLSRPHLLRHAALAALVALAGGLPWMVRNSMATGYPLFPSPVAALPVEWRIPEPKVRSIGELIRAWARHPSKQSKAFRKRLGNEQENILLGRSDPMSQAAFRNLVRGTPWFSEWIADSMRSTIFAAGLCGPPVLGLALLLLRRRDKPGGATARSLDPLVIPLGAAVAFWLYAAPAVRFGLPFLALLLLLPCAQVCAGLPMRPASLRWLAGILSAVLTAAAFANGFPPRSKLWNSIVFPPRAMAETVPFTTRSGLVVTIPKNDARSFDSPLPATFYRNPYLSLLDPDRGIAGGFKDETPPPPAEAAGG
ncbi:MAG: hypothetical protein BWK77_04700 [Verrucomicrobia bacterium A1]|nr:MAG: hypothetical protein BWK77_04700 [Verrucomicrobia bacterium A1]